MPRVNISIYLLSRGEELLPQLCIVGVAKVILRNLVLGGQIPQNVVLFVFPQPMLALVPSGNSRTTSPRHLITSAKAAVY